MSKFIPCLLRGFNNYDVKAASDLASTDSGDEPSMTQQHFKDECDVNVMMERFALTGELPSNVRAPMYGDFTSVSDYQSALNAVIAADEAFMQLPPAVRRRFDNDAALFVDFCSDPGNIDAMREMGLAVKEAQDDDDEGVRGSGSVVGGPARAAVGGGAGDRGPVGGGQRDGVAVPAGVSGEKVR